MRHTLFILLGVLSFSPPSVLSQVNWTRHPNNPVFHSSSANPYDPMRNRWAFQPSVLYDESRRAYLAWLSCWVDGTTQYTYSNSLAVSFDGADWFYYSKNPVIAPSPGGFDERELSSTFVMEESAGYRMYYTGCWQSWQCGIGLATSSDGLEWKKAGASPVLSPGSAGTWDDLCVGTAHVLRVGEVYYMWYTGRSSDLRPRIGLATSPNGVTWTKHPANPVLGFGAPGGWDSDAVGYGRVVLVNGVFHMIFTGDSVPNRGRIGLATSLDGVTWQRYPGNPVIVPQSGWEGSRVDPASLLFRDSKFHLWYEGFSGGVWQCGYATANLETVTAPPEPGLPTRAVLEQNYPNPFNPTTNIQFTIVNRQSTIVRVHDVLGRDIATLVNEVKEPGTYTVQWSAKGGSASGGDASGVSSGVYFYRLSAGNFVQTKRMLLLR